MKRGWVILLVAGVLFGGWWIAMRKGSAFQLSNFREVLKDATSLRVRSGGTCHRDVTNEKTLFESKDPGVVQQLVAGIDILPKQSGFHCMCCGEPTLEFYAGERLIAEIGFHHGRSIRWLNGSWPGDALLEQSSAEFLVKWLLEHGVNGPQREIDRKLEHERATERKVEVASEGLSASLKTALRDDGFAGVLKREVADELAQIKILFRLLGSSNGSWTMQEWLETRADNALRNYPRSKLEEAATAALLSEDHLARRGAARFWQGWQSPLEEWQPKNVALYQAILDMQQAARYYPLRIEALRRLERWSTLLPKEEVQDRLKRGLRDPHPSVRRKALLTAGSLPAPEVIPHLVSVLNGETGSTDPLVPVPEYEEMFVDEGFDDVAGKRPESEVAALALGYLRHTEAEPIIRGRLATSEMYAVALALMGHPECLTQSHFQNKEENQELQLAAVEAVVRAKGRVGFEFLLKYRQCTHWWEEEYVAREVREMLQGEGAPGNITEIKDFGSMASWERAYGAAYRRRFESGN